MTHPQLLEILKECREGMDRTSGLTTRLSLENDTVITRVFITKEDYEACRLPFYVNVRREAVAV